jgi:GDP-4-dehydro-6-deoxy-D-mannose reductase
LASFVVSGARGFIGRQLVTELTRLECSVVAIGSADGDIAEAGTWQRLPPVETVVHLAARSFVPDSWISPTEFMRVNLLGTCAALDYCRRHGARLVFVSSYLYGMPDHLPISEDAPLIATNPYALSKKIAEEACQFHAEHCGVDVTVLRPFNIYGVGQPEHFLVPTILRQIQRGDEIRVKDLDPRRDYVYVHDVVAAITLAARAWDGFRVFNIGTGTSHSVAELIDTIQQLWDVQLPVVSSEDRRKSEIMDTVADIRAARTELGWEPRYSLREGLADLRAAIAAR